VVEVLRHRHVDGEVRRVAATRNELRHAERGFHARLAGAAVLLPLVVPDHVAARDDVDLFAFLKLSRPLLELTAALRAGLVGLVEAVDLFHPLEARLLARTVTGLLLLL